jgi:hypothetical protein
MKKKENRRNQVVRTIGTRHSFANYSDAAIDRILEKSTPSPEAEIQTPKRLCGETII